MSKLCVVIFSRNYIYNAINLINDVYSIADKILLMDASDRKEADKLHRAKRALHLDKLDIFRVPPIGYPDPLRMYALGKCKGNWVLYIDTDERISEELKNDIRNIINGDYDAYAIKRYEEVKDPGILPAFATWQIRLFKSDSVVFKGLPHEQPKVKGKLGRLDGKKHYMMHMSALMSRKTQLDYMEIEKFERLTYGMYNQKVLDYFSKLLLKEDRDMRKTLTGKVVLSILKACQRLTLKKGGQELSNFDYFCYYATLDLVYYTLEGNVKGLINIISKERKHIEQINKWQRERDGKEVLGISKIINRIGITEFLRLDRESTIKAVNRRREKGSALLLALIKEQYRSIQDPGKY